MSNYATLACAIVGLLCMWGCSISIPPEPVERTARERTTDRELFQLQVDVRELTQRVKTLEGQVNSLRKP